MAKEVALARPDVRQSEAVEQYAASELTIVRIKRRRDDPAEPEIILEAAGAHINKQPRYDEVLLQFQGLAVLNSASTPAATAPRRRFRRLRTMDVSVFEAMSECEVLQLLGAQSGAAPSTSTAAALTRPTASTAAVASSTETGAPGLAATGPLQHSLPLQQSPLPAAAPGGGGPSHRSPVKGSRGPTPESRITALRSSHKQAAAAARYKQIRRKRGSAAGDQDGDPEARSRLRMYDLERLNAFLPAERRSVLAGTSAARGKGGSRDAPPLNRPQQWPQPRQQSEEEQQQLQQVEEEEECARRGAPRSLLEQNRQQPGQPPPGAPAVMTAEEALMQRYAPLVDEVLRSLSERQPQRVHRIPARPKRAHKAAAAAAAGASPTAEPDAPQRAAREAAGLSIPVASVVPTMDGAAACAPSDVTSGQEAGGAVTGAWLSTAAAVEGDDGGGGGVERRMGDDDEGFVYDVYLPVPEDGDGGAEAGEEEPWPWLDAPAGVDMAVPVIEVAEDDDEFFWAGVPEAEAAQRAAEAEEHDSEDSNAESFYANTYPDEEGAPYGNDDGSDGDDDFDLGGGEPLDADMGADGWGEAPAMRLRSSFSDDDDEGDDGDGEANNEGDDCALGRRRRRHVRPTKVTYYRTEDDDYSDHSSFLSEEEERREAEERRQRAVFMH